MFVPRYILGELDLSDAPFMVLQGEDRGAPQNVAQVIDSMLDDGEVVSVDRRSNRSMAYTVYIEEADLQACAEAEAALLAECNKPVNTFKIDPGDGYGAVTVFDTFTVQATFVYDPDAEEMCLRRYDLTFQALPFARAETLTTVAALTVGAGTDAQIDACDSTTGWTVTGGTLALDTSRKYEGTGSLAVAPAVVDAQERLYAMGPGWYRVTTSCTFTKTGLSVNLSTTPYISVKTDNGGPPGIESITVETTVDGVAAAATGVAWVGSDGWSVHSARSTDASVASVSFKITQVQVIQVADLATIRIRIDDVRRGPTVPGVGSTTGRESLRLVPVYGSARTPVSLAVEHETLGVGQALIYTNPILTGDTPDMLRWKTSGSAVGGVDAASIAGTWQEVGTSTPEVFRKPLDPMYRGGYLLLARGHSATFADVQLTASTRLSTGALIGTRVSRNRNVQTVNGFAILGDLTLPIADVPPGSNAQLQLEVLSMGSVVAYEEMFLCPMGEDAALTLVDCGAGTTATLGTANNRLWIDSATLERPSPATWLGSAAGKMDAYIATNARRMAHQFVPPSTLVFVANTGGANPAVSASYFERAHTHIVARSA